LLSFKKAFTITKRIKKSACDAQKIAEYIEGDCWRDKAAAMKKWPTNKKEIT
jgi:hypothetical protein